jgi:ATP-binding cassette subfamily B protein
VERAAFARARRFLNYNLVAKWSALTAAVGTGILYVGLLVLLALFADLLVNRGRIPSYLDIPAAEKMAFEQDLLALEKKLQPSKEKSEIQERQNEIDRLRKHLKEFGIEDSQVRRLAETPNPSKLSEREQELRKQLLWYLDVDTFLQNTVDPQAAQLFRQAVAANIQDLGLEMALGRDVEDFGVISLLVRTRYGMQGSLVSWLASWNSWMWQWGNEYYLVGLLYVALLVALLRALLMFLTDYMAARATIEAATRLRRAVYHHTYRLGTLAFRALGPSEAVGVFTRHLEAVHDALYAWLTVVFREPVKFVLVLLFALMVNFWLALAFLLAALLVWLLGGQIAAYFRRQGRLATHRAANQLALLQESLMLMRLVKVYLMELFNQSRVERQLSRYARAQMRRFMGEAIYRPALVFLGMLAALGLLFVVGEMIIVHSWLGVTSAIVLATALVSLYWPLENWLEHRRFLRRGRESAIVLFEFLDRTGGVGQVVGAEFLPPMTKRLEFDNVTLQEPGTGRKLLRGVSLTIQAGQKVAIVGPEEMEKHALVYLLPRFLDPTSGEIRIDDHNLRWVTFDSLRIQIAMVLQHNLVFNDTVANNIGCGDPSYTLPQIIEAAKTAHAHQFIQKLPQGYETPIGEMGHSLAVGEKMRIALARAILRDPAMLIIEEPYTPLDDDTKSLLDDTYARVLPGRTAIFLPHRLSTIRSSDRVFLLYNGRIEAAGEHRELLQQHELYRHLQYLEFNEFAGIATGQASVG